MNWHEQIVIDPAVAQGRPTLRTAKLPVLPLVEALLEGTSIERLCAQYPQLNCYEVAAMISYARTLVLDREPTRLQQLAIITEMAGLICFAFGYGLSLTTLFSYEVVGFILLAYLITWLSRRFQLLDYAGKLSSFRVKPLLMIGACVLGFAACTLFAEPPFIPTLILGAVLLSVSELCNENRYLRWLSWGKWINIILMASPILLLISFVILRLINGGSLSLYDSLLLLAYSLLGAMITALTYRRFLNTRVQGMAIRQLFS
ncbi:MAG: DUF433 domain-containing protein [Acidobacteriota bacterium]